MMDTETQEQDCAICLQKYHHPTRLPCGHVFCFLCVKGIAIQSKRCAMCRKQIPHDYFDHPDLIEKLSLEEISSDGNTAEYQWYYEGRNGWWKYDERSNIDLESKYSSGETECLLLLAGAIYCVDFQNMIQIRRNDPTKRRKVKRDVPTLPSKGIAGIKKVQTSQSEATDTATDFYTNNVSVQETEEIVVIEDESEDEVSNNNSTNTPTELVDDLSDSVRQIRLNPEDPINVSPDESSFSSEI